MPPTVALSPGRVRQYCAADQLDLERPLETIDIARFRAWADRYLDLARSEADSRGLLALGRELYHWLNSPAPWLDRLCNHQTPPLIIEFQAPIARDPTADAFLEVPWELLANGGGFLAADPLLMFAAVRRLGEPFTPPVPASGRRALRVTPDLPPDQPPVKSPLDRAAVSGRPDPGDVIEMPWPEALRRQQETPSPSPGTNASAHAQAPRLVCLTPDERTGQGECAKVVPPLVRAGMPAVFAWAGQVREIAARQFARNFYSRLSRREPLEMAYALARDGLIEAGEAEPPDWHLARLTLGPRGGGRLV